jgi:hypothetical protein
MSDSCFKIGNEFAYIEVQKVYTRNGEFLEIDSKRSGTKIRLDAMQLESLTFLNSDNFSKFFELHYGVKESI